MKQFFLALIFLSSLAAISCNNNDTAAKTPAEVEAILNDSSKYTTVKWSDTAIDFGTKKMGDLVNITFACTNTGNKPLYLYDVHPSCGCTLVDYSKAPIAPGQQGKIEAQFDTKKSHPSVVHKTIFVRYNAGNTSTYLKFTGTVVASDSSTTANK
jgi:hypothetical protein